MKIIYITKAPNTVNFDILDEDRWLSWMNRQGHIGHYFIHDIGVFYKKLCIGTILFPEAIEELSL